MEKKHFYPVLTGTFLGITAGVAFLQGGQLHLPQGLELIPWGLAALRLGRMLAFDVVMSPERALLGIKTVKDGSGMGESTESTAEGPRGALGDLFCCPTCAATWGIGAGLLTAYQFPLLVPLVSLIVTILALTAFTDVGQAAIEFLEWNGQLGRERAGELRQAKEQVAHMPYANPDYWATPQYSAKTLEKELTR